MAKVHTPSVSAVLICRDCYYYEPDGTRAKEGACCFDPPVIISLGDGTILFERPRVANDTRACSKFSNRPRVVN